MTGFGLCLRAHGPLGRCPPKSLTPSKSGRLFASRGMVPRTPWRALRVERLQGARQGARGMGICWAAFCDQPVRKNRLGLPSLTCGSASCEQALRVGRLRLWTDEKIRGDDGIEREPEPEWEYVNPEDDWDVKVRETWQDRKARLKRSRGS